MSGSERELADDGVGKVPDLRGKRPHASRLVEYEDKVVLSEA